MVISRFLSFLLFLPFFPSLLSLSSLSSLLLSVPLSIYLIYLFPPFFFFLSVFFQVTFPDTLPPSAVEMLEKVLPSRPVTDFDGEEEEPMLEVRCIPGILTLKIPLL